MRKKREAVFTYIKSVVSQSQCRGTKCDCKIDCLWVRSPLEKVKLHLHFSFFTLASRQSAVLSSATQHAMPPEVGVTWGTECLSSRFPLPILLCAGYSVKLINKTTTISSYVCHRVARARLTSRVDTNDSFSLIVKVFLQNADLFKFFNDCIFIRTPSCLILFLYLARDF